MAQDHTAGVRLIIMIAGKGIAALTQDKSYTNYLQSRPDAAA
ncbi:hypothetical protein [uncultured Subdoligranulum sp.]|nr:hypothetical protein [uncultured Subdoligranulum sp.]